LKGEEKKRGLADDLRKTGCPNGGGEKNVSEGGKNQTVIRGSVNCPSLRNQKSEEKKKKE